MNIHIIGCGILGSNLAYSIICSSFNKTFGSLWLYDSDIVTDVMFPYDNFMFLRMHKSSALKYILNSKDKTKSIISKQKIDNDFDIFKNDKDIVIDCRDNKTTLEKVDIELSCDKYSLIIDTTKPKNHEDKVFNTYYYPKCVGYLNFIINILFKDIIFCDEIPKKKMLFKITDFCEDRDDD